MPNCPYCNKPSVETIFPERIVYRHDKHACVYEIDETCLFCGSPLVRRNLYFDFRNHARLEGKCRHCGESINARFSGRFKLCGKS